MVLVSDVAEYDKLVRAMYVAKPTACRFTVKSKQLTQEVTLKATDGSQTLKFKAADASAIKRIEKLTRWFIDRMVSLEVVDAIAE
jgi:hypothetical protein